MKRHSLVSRSVCMLGLVGLIAGLGIFPDQARAGYELRSIDVVTHIENGVEYTQERSYTYELPSEGAMPKDGWPVVVLFHGANQNVYRWSDGGNWRMKSSYDYFLEEGFAVVALESACVVSPDNKKVKNWKLQTNDPSVNMRPYVEFVGAKDNDCANTEKNIPNYGPFTNPDINLMQVDATEGDIGNVDMRFVRDVFTGFASDPNINSQDIHIAGLSAGGMMVQLVANFLDEGPYWTVKSALVQAVGYFSVSHWIWDLDISAPHPDLFIVRGAWDFGAGAYSQEKYRYDVASSTFYQSKACRGMDWNIGHNWSSLYNDWFVLNMRGNLPYCDDTIVR